MFSFFQTVFTISLNSHHFFQTSVSFKFSLNIYILFLSICLLLLNLQAMYEFRGEFKYKYLNVCMHIIIHVLWWNFSNLQLYCEKKNKIHHAHVDNGFAIIVPFPFCIWRSRLFNFFPILSLGFLITVFANYRYKYPNINSGINISKIMTFFKYEKLLDLSLIVFSFVFLIGYLSLSRDQNILRKNSEAQVHTMGD